MKTRKRLPTRKRLCKFNKGDKKIKPRILYYDIEISSMVGRVWELYEANVLDLEKNWYIMSFSYKWDDGPTKVLALPDFPRYKRNPEDDKDLVKEMWKLFNQCSATCAHNNKKFDHKKANTRFIKHGLPPPSPYKVYDTLQTARKHFGFSSNKLNDLAEFLGIGTKVETGGYSLWKKCLEGDMKAWRRMKLYNKVDTELLYKVYLKLRPWLQEAHVTSGCPKCGSNNLEKRGFRLNTGMRYQRYMCKNCTGWSSERKGERIEKTLLSL